MSKLKVTTIANVADSESTDVTNVINGSAKAWVNFNGTGTVAIRESFNVSSITDNGTGNYTVSFTNAMPDANYAVVGVAQFSTSGGSQSFVAVNAASSPYQTTSINVVGVRSDTAALTDFVVVNVATFR